MLSVRYQQWCPQVTKSKSIIDLFEAEEVPATDATPGTSERKRAILLLLLLASVLTIFFWPVLTGMADFYLSDVSYYFQPFCSFMRRSVMVEGQPPFWNPYMYCGMSQIAVPSPGIFYPATWLMVLLPFSCGLALYMMLHQIIAAVGAYLLVRRCKFGTEGAVVGAAICSLSGYMFALSSNFTLMAAAAWTPLCIFLLLTIDDSVSFRNVRRAVLLALCAAAVIATGRPEVGAPALVLCGICAIWPFVEFVRAKRSRLPEGANTANDSKSAMRTVGIRLFPLALAVVINAPIVLPALEWTRISPRSQGMELHYVFTWSANWYDFLNLVLNNPVGDLLDLPNKFRNMVTSRVNYLPFLSNAYIGPAAITLAFWGLFEKRWNQRWLLLGLFVMFCILTAGSNTPVAPSLVRLSSALTAFRYPIKLIVFPVMIIALFSAAGTRLALEKRLPLPVQITSTIFWLVVLITGIVMICSPGLSLLLRPSDHPQLMSEAQVLFGWSILTAALIGFGLNALMFGYQFGRLPRRAFFGMVTVLVTAPMLVCASGYSRHWAPAVELSTSIGTLKIGYFDFRSQLAAKLRELNGPECRSVSLYFDPLVVPPWYQVSKTWTHDEKFYEHARQLLLPNTHVAEYVRQANGYEAAETKEYKQFFREAFANCSQNEKAKGALSDIPIARFCALTATNIAVTQAFGRAGKSGNAAPVKELDPKYFERLSDDLNHNARIFRLRLPSLRCRFARQITVLPDLAAVQKNFLTGAIEDTTLPYVAVFAGDDCKNISEQLRRRLNGTPDLHVNSNNSGFREGAEFDDLYKCSAKIISNTQNRIVIQTDNSQPGLLILSDHYYPGWKAAVDDKQTPIMRANIFSRAVEVPAGEHTVTFEYCPDSLLGGLGISAAALSILAIALIWSKRQETKSIVSSNHAN